MVDNLSLLVEELAQKEGSYIDAVLEFSKKFEYVDIEDFIEILHPLVVQKVRQEFIEKKFIPSLIPKNSLKEFF